MKIFKVGDRNFPHAGKMFGKEGEYELPDEVAKQFEKEGKGKIIKSLSVDSVPTYLDPPDERFLAQVRRHASQMIEIFEQEDKRRREAEHAARMKELDEMEAKAKEKDVKNESENKDSKSTSDTSVNTGSLQNENVKEPINTENEKSSDEGPKSEPIPDNFVGRDKLLAAGIKTMDEIPRTKEGLIGKGIPAKIADQIGVALQNR